MGLLKSDLRISAGLLKEAAPDNHLLAYITPNERDMLVQAGGSGHITKSGIPSFESSWDSSVDDGGWDGYESGPPDDSSHDFSTDIGTVGDTEYTPPAHVPDYESGSAQSTRAGMSEEMANRTRELTKAQHEAVLGDHGDPLGDPEEQAKYARYVKYTAENQPLNKTEDLTFRQHWDNAPEFLKWSPTLRLLYAGGKNLGEWARSKGWNWDSTTGKVTDNDGNEVSESDMHGATASQAPHIVGGTTTSTASSTSPSSVWFNNLSSSQSGFNLKSSYANAKAAVSQRLGKPSSVGLLAVNDSPYYNWLKDNSLNKGIL
jgi:hypothetical protein